MNRRGAWLLIGWIAFAVWLSDRWMWTLPGLAVAVQPSRWLLVGFVCLSSILLGVGAVLALKLNIPRWLSRWWDWLLQER